MNSGQWVPTTSTYQLHDDYLHFPFTDMESSLGYLSALKIWNKVHGIFQHPYPKKMALHFAAQTYPRDTYSLPFKLGSIDQLQECSFAVGLTAVRIISRPFSGKHCGLGSVLLCHRLPEGAQPCTESTPQVLSPRRWPYSFHVFPHLFQQVKSSGQELPANVYYGTWPNFLEDHSFSRINCY